MRKKDWILISVLTLLAIACVRLGIWQLGRRQEKLSQNEWITAQLSQEPSALEMGQIDVEEWEYRKVEVAGTYHNQHSVILRNRSFADQPGVHLVTPLTMENSSEGILVVRGWISNQAYLSGGIEPFRVEQPVQIVGIIRQSQPEPSFAFLADPTKPPGSMPILEWRVLNVDRLQSQIPFDVRPFYLELLETDVDGEGMPVPNPEIDLSQGPHLSYAIQWFGFALIALGGSVAWWRRSRSRKEEIKHEFPGP